MIDRITPDETTQAPPASQEDELAVLREYVAFTRAINRNPNMTPAQKQTAHAVYEHFEGQRWRPDNRPRRIFLPDIAELCGMDRKTCGTYLQQLALMGLIEHTHEYERLPNGRTIRHVCIARGEMWERPSELCPERVKNGHGGERVTCAKCGSENVEDVHTRYCHDCQHSEVISRERPNDEPDPIEDDGEKQSQPTPRPAPIPFPTRPHPQPQPTPKAATPCPLDPRGLHEYAARRDARGRRVCIECGEPEPMREEMH